MNPLENLTAGIVARIWESTPLTKKGASEIITAEMRDFFSQDGGNCKLCSWAALAHEVAKETDGGGGQCSNVGEHAPADLSPWTPERLAERIWDIGARAACDGALLHDLSHAKHSQQQATRAIAEWVLKNFNPKGAE